MYGHGLCIPLVNLKNRHRGYMLSIKYHKRSSK